jgi:hypothetical protein
MNTWKRISPIVLKCAALGLAGAVVVVDTLTVLEPESGVSLLALGLACLALAILQKDA